MKFEQVSPELASVAGAMTADEIPAAWKAMLKFVRHNQPQTLDLTHLERVDTAGLAALLALKSESRGELKIVNPAPQLCNLARMNQVADLL